MKAYNKISLTHFAATICKVMGIEAPKEAAEPLDWVCDVLDDLCKDGFDRVLIHNPDAVGMWLYQAYPDAFEPVLKHTQLTVPFKTVMPSVTPVCFVTMYTGALPEVHGIQSYTKPVIKIDTFFDAVLRAGKKVAMIVTPNCSLARVFLERDIDFYHVDTEQAAVVKAQELILKDEHDVICVYTFMFDTLTHRAGTESPETLEALYRQGVFFDTLVSTVKRRWKQHNTLIAFSPDHGAHDVPAGEVKYGSKGNIHKGTHGTDMTEDLNILHYFGVVRRSVKD